MKYRVVCVEEVSTEFFVEAPDEERLREWLDGDEGADAVSMHCNRQTVREREFEIVEPWTGNEKVDHDTEKPDDGN
jgi:hypothetical protein